MSPDLKNAPRYVPVEQARSMPGVRIAFNRAGIGPWSTGVRAIYDLKGIDYIAVPHEAGGPNEALTEWTGQNSAPVLMRDDDRIRTLWSEMLVLAEQLQPEPRLIPKDEDERITMFGVCHELCGDDGLGWNIRLLSFSDQRAANDTEWSSMFDKYGSPVSYDHIVQRLASILDALARRIERQAAAGSRYLVGTSLTAADIYWAAFSNLLDKMSEDLFATNPGWSHGLDKKLMAHLPSPIAKSLLDHRDYVVRAYFRIPIAF